MIIEKCQAETVANSNTTAQRNTTGTTTQHTANPNTTQCNTTGTTTQHTANPNTTQRNTTGKHATPDRYATGGRAGRLTENSTEKFGQKTLHIWTVSTRG